MALHLHRAEPTDLLADGLGVGRAHGVPPCQLRSQQGQVDDPIVDMPPGEANGRLSCESSGPKRRATAVMPPLPRPCLSSGLFEGLERQRDRDLVAHHGATTVERQLGADSEILAA
jgi:hypothetical protein